MAQPQGAAGKAGRSAYAPQQFSLPGILPSEEVLRQLFQVWPSDVGRPADGFHPARALRPAQ